MVEGIITASATAFRGIREVRPSDVAALAAIGHRPPPPPSEIAVHS